MTLLHYIKDPRMNTIQGWVAYLDIVHRFFSYTEKGFRNFSFFKRGQQVEKVIETVYG